MNGRLSTPSHARGFSLVELMVTIAVLTILISVGVPMYGQFTQGSAVSTGTSELVGSLNLARSEAVARRASVRIEQLSATAGDWSAGWQVVLDADDSQIRIVQGVNKGLVAILETGDATELVFDREGRVSANATFNIGVAGATTDNGRIVTLSRFGRVGLEVAEVDMEGYHP